MLGVNGLIHQANMFSHPSNELGGQRTNIVDFFGFSTSLLIKSLSSSLGNNGVVSVFVRNYIVIRLVDEIVVLFVRHVGLCCQNLLAVFSPLS